MTIEAQDLTGTISASDLASLNGRPAPFHVRVLFTSQDSLEKLEDISHGALSTPDMVVIGIDPGHHRVVARFGTATGVKPGDFDSVAKAGNAHFRAKEWTAGVDAIAVRAKASADSRVAMSVSNEPIVIEQGLSGWAWTGIAILFAAVIACVVAVIRRMRRQQTEFNQTVGRLNDDYISRDDARDFDSRLRAAERRQPTATGYAGGYPTGVTQSSGPVIINQGGNNDLLTGVLIGESLSSPLSRVVEREFVRESPREEASDGGGSSSVFGGSSSTDYGDTSSSSSSDSDSGGSDSSWGGGD